MPRVSAGPLCCQPSKGQSATSPLRAVTSSVACAREGPGGAIGSTPLRLDVSGADLSLGTRGFALRGVETRIGTLPTPVADGGDAHARPPPSTTLAAAMSVPKAQRDRPVGARLDARTVSAFLGMDTLEPLLARADATGAGLFVLTRTSNLVVMLLNGNAQLSHQQQHFRAYILRRIVWCNGEITFLCLDLVSQVSTFFYPSAIPSCFNGVNAVETAAFA